MMWRVLLWALMYAFVVTGAHATWKPEYSTATPEQIQWFKNAQTTPEARARLGWSSCCDNADRYITTFEQDELTEKWYFLREGTKVLIPADTIHHEDDPKMPQQLKAEGVLFIVNGVVACFWPPQTGG